MNELLYYILATSFYFFSLIGAFSVLLSFILLIWVRFDESAFDYVFYKKLKLW